jgi:hypothetical protein
MTHDEIITAIKKAHANLTGANLTDTTGLFQIVPEIGAFEGFKRLADDIIAHLHIPPEAERVGGWVGRKCRAEYVETIALLGGDGAPRQEGFDRYTMQTSYVPGQVTRPDSWNNDPRLECTNGIHFFLTFAEAEAYL